MDETIYLILAAAVFIAIAFITIVLGTSGITQFGNNSDSIQDNAADEDITGPLLNDFSMNETDIRVETISNSK